MPKLLITGAGGFIGSHLVEQCVNEGFTVKAFVRYNSRNSWGWLEKSEYKNEIETITGDVRDYDLVFDSLKDCSAVFHLAALIGIPYSYVSPLAYLKTNIEGTYNVLQAARMVELDQVLITSTSETYGTAQYVPINEKHPMVGQSPYSASKIAADQLAISYYRSFDMPVKIVRPFNTYGPRQSSRAIIPTIITQLVSGNQQLSLGNLSPTRDLTYVKDTVNGFLEIYKSKNLFGEIINIGMNEEISMQDLTSKLIELCGTSATVEQNEERFRPGNSEVERLRCDNTKLTSQTDWRPVYNIESGLKETIDWIKNHLADYKPEIYNL